MKLLVTGRDGQLARSLAERSAGAAGIELTFVARPEVDLAVEGSLAAAIAAARPDVVVNAAAYTAVDKAEDEPELALRINGAAAGEAAEAAARVGAAIIHVSTDYVFDGRASTPYREDSAMGPINAYGRTKLAGEEAVRAGNPRHVILRTAWVVSPFGSNFIKTMLRLAETRDELRVVGDQQGCPTDARDLADAILAIAGRWRDEPELGLGETYHVAGTGQCSWAELAGQVMADSAAAGGPSARVVPITTADYPTRAARPGYSVLDSDKVARTFGVTMPEWRAATGRLVQRLLA